MSGRFYDSPEFGLLCEIRTDFQEALLVDDLDLMNLSTAGVILQLIFSAFCDHL
jgi:hypothetical protein